MKCRHCHRNKQCRPRGLCSPCSLDPAVRRLYPSRSPCGAWADDPDGIDPSDADLDRIVAEQYPTMPTERGERRTRDVGRRVAGVYRLRINRRRGL